MLEENAQTLTAIGFCWEMFGDREYLITGVPADFLNLEPKQLFLELLDNLRNQNTKSAPEFVIDHCATMACKAAVKGNHTMSYAEAKRTDWADVTDGSAVSLSTWKTDNDCNEPV